MSRTVKQWKQSEIRFLRENYNRLSYGTIAKQLNRSKSSVCSYALKILNLRKEKPVFSNGYTPEQESLLRTHGNSLSMGKLIELLDRSEGSISYRMKKLGITPKSKH